MISLVICSRTSQLSSELQQNIESTIGCEHQLVVIDNSRNSYDIFQAYNEGVKRSKYDIICFMHDDILYHTNGWGPKVMEWFNNPEIGMLGISGSTYMSRIPAIWWASGYWGNRIAIRQNSVDTDKHDPQNSTRTCVNPQHEPCSEVLMNDGLFFCIRKSLFDNGIRFDESTFQGFHFYDLDISFQVREKGYKVVCVYDILIEHRCHSVLNRTWLSAARVFYDKWTKRGTLPALTVNYDAATITDLEYATYKTARHILRENNVGFFSYFNWSEHLYILWARLSHKLNKKFK